MRRLVRYDNMLKPDNNTSNFKKCMCAVNARKVFLFSFFFLSVVICALWEVNWSKVHAGYCKEGYPCVAIGEILVLIDCLG